MHHSWQVLAKWKMRAVPLILRSIYSEERGSKPCSRNVVLKPTTQVGAIRKVMKINGVSIMLRSRKKFEILIAVLRIMITARNEIQRVPIDFITGSGVFFERKDLLQNLDYRRSMSRVFLNTSWRQKKR